MDEIKWRGMIHEMSWTLYPEPKPEDYPTHLIGTNGGRGYYDWYDSDAKCPWSGESYEVRVIGYYTDEGVYIAGKSSIYYAAANKKRARPVAEILDSITYEASHGDIEALFDSTPFVPPSSFYKEGTLRAYAHLARVTLYARAREKRLRYFKRAADALICVMKIPTLQVEDAFDGYIPQGKRT